MHECALALAAYFGFALLHAVSPRRGNGLQLNVPAVWRGPMRALSGLVVAVATWSAAETLGTAQAIFVMLAAWLSVATACVLLAPLFPRLVWGTAAASVPAWLIIQLWTHAHG